MAFLKEKVSPMISEISQENLNKGDTWPKVLKYNYEKYGSRHKAMRRKHFGIWQSYTWQDYYLSVKYLALGLLSLGFKAGDKLLIVGDNAPEWYFAVLAAQSNHGISVGLYSDLTESEIKYISTNSESAFAFIEDQEQVDKFFQIKKELPLLKKIIYWRYKGLPHYLDPTLIGYRQVLELGRDYEKKHPGLFEENVASGNADDVCSLIYTSGTTCEVPKGTMHSFKTIRYGSEYYLHLDPWYETDNVVSYLPPAWIFEQWFGLGCHLLSGSTINFPEEADTQQQDIREIGPTMIFYSPRLWERQASWVQARIRGADFLKKFTYRLFMPVGYKMADFKIKKQKPGPLWSKLNALGNLFLFRPIRDSLGLTNARICYTAGSMLSPDVIRFYHALKVPLKSLYGSTEGGALTGASNDDIRLDTVGTLNPGAEVRITKAGEIISRQPGTFLGYYNDPAATAEVLKDGWFHGGDSGYFTEDKHLVFVDRLKDIVELTHGDKLAPQDIESRLKFSPYIKDAWILAGPGREYPSAIIIIDHENVGHWADGRKVTYTTYTDLSQKPEVYELVEQEIARVNKDLPTGCRVRKYVNLHKEFDPDEAELTRNRKLRRAFLEKRYCGLIEAIYSGKTEVPIEVQIKYQDGRTGTIKTVISIKSVEGANR
jgi:long-chain acyl-CoA synthetase